MNGADEPPRTSPAAEPAAAADGPVRHTGVVRAIERVGERVIEFVDEVGGMAIMLGRIVRWLPRRPFRPALYFQQMDFVGVQSLFIVLLTGTFTGMVFSYQSAYAFSLFNAESLVGSTVILALARELGPVLTALMVTGRAASAMATELGSMRVSEQIDALETMAVEPVHYLVLPRVVAATIVLPMLTMFFICVGSAGAYVVAVLTYGFDEGTFFARIRDNVQLEDFVQGCVKGAIFGAILSFIGCYRGYHATGGARGVGTATTGAVVMASVTILVVDYFVTVLFFT